ncbi:MAG: helix-turn-helix transcriptional regulator [Spirochaetia bacterium]|jgi:transcriptional regulator with XRE-family HTH domain
MMKSLDDKMKSLGSARRRKIEKRAAALFAEEMTLRELRRARKITQVRVAKALGIRQEGISRLEKRSDLLLSTLRNAVKAMGGDLRLVAEFPNRKPVVLKGIAERESKPVPTRQKHARPRPKDSVPRR